MPARLLPDGWPVLVLAVSPVLVPSRQCGAISVKPRGELLHPDIKKLGRFERTGHRITGSRRGRSQGAGGDYLHVAINDATRLAYVEVLPDETRRSTTSFLIRALRWFKVRGVGVQRVMTDNGSGYIAKLFRRTLERLSIRHIRTRPYTPKTNGKAERFIQTMLREWANAIPFRSSLTREADLPRWLDWYNTKRPHMSINSKTPVQVLGCGLIKPHPDTRTGNEYGGEIVSRRLFVSCGHFSEMLELVEEALDKVALAVECWVDRTLHLAIALRGDVSAPAMCRDQVENGAGVIAAIGDDIARRGVCRQQRRDRRLVGSLSGRQSDGER